MKFDVIIVVYNTVIFDSPAYLAVQKSDSVNKIIVCDNSTDQFVINKNAGVESSKKIYLPMNGNVGLSKAYNRALARVDAPFVLVLDDDTQVPNDFFDKLNSYIDSDDFDIFLPLVCSRGTMMSPCKKKTFRFREFPSSLKIQGRISAINSGVVAKRAVFDIIKYDENLFLDMVDHKFFDEVREQGLKVRVMKDVILEQDYSRETDNYSAAQCRFVISKRDNRVYFSNTFFGSIFCEIQIFYWKIKQCFKFRRLSPMGW